MKTIAALLAVAALALAANPADAKGCLKGAVVGGVAGHYAGHHGLLGAAAGCIYGRHHAKEQERQKQEQQAAAGRAGEAVRRLPRSLPLACYPQLHKNPSCPAKAGYPVRASFSIQSPASLEYWITRFRG